MPFNGRLLAEYYCGGMIFDHPDEIGTATSATDCTGQKIQERLYYPFGELWTGYNLYNLGMHQEFALLADYDPETDQYNTPNRHYNPMGRWLSPDPGGLGYVHLDDPQTWNMYAYVRNNPTTLTDPSGLGEPTYTSSPPGTTSSCVTTYGNGPCGQPPTEATQTGANTEAQNQSTESQVVVGVVIGLWNALASTANLMLDQDTRGHYAPLPELKTEGTAEEIGSLASVALFFMVPGAGEEEAAAQGAELASRAAEIHGALDDIAAGMRTTAIADVTTTEGTAGRVVASSEPTLTPAQRGTLKSGEVAIRGEQGAHAEQKITSWAEKNGATVNGIAASRPICSTCPQIIRSMFSVMFPH